MYIYDASNQVVLIKWLIGFFVKLIQYLQYELD